MYKVNFEKIKQSSTDFKGKDCFKPDEDLKGVYWNEEDISGRTEIPEDKYKHLPIVCIYEGIRDHMTQILFILKEDFTDIELGFTGWKSFSKGDLITLCKGEYDIYRDNWRDGDKFVLEFPEKINYIIDKYCDECN